MKRPASSTSDPIDILKYIAHLENTRHIPFTRSMERFFKEVERKQPDTLDIVKDFESFQFSRRCIESLTVPKKDIEWFFHNMIHHQDQDREQIIFKIKIASQFVDLPACVVDLMDDDITRLYVNKHSLTEVVHLWTQPSVLLYVIKLFGMDSYTKSVLFKHHFDVLTSVFEYVPPELCKHAPWWSNVRKIKVQEKQSLAMIAFSKWMNV